MQSARRGGAENTTVLQITWSIARAAAADPAVLLLDEVTANLDAETEARVLEALRRASAGRTVLSVSHRIYENLGGRTVKIEPQNM